MTPAPDGPAESAAPPAVCWRCGLAAAPGRPRCPHCAARPRGDPAPTPAPADEWGQLRALLLAFLATMAGSVAWAWRVFFGPPLAPAGLQAGTAALEAADTAVAVALLCALGRLPGPPASARTRVLAWLAAGPALAALLGANYAYAALLRWLAPGLPEPDPEPLTAAAVLLTCVQPAVVEELFFRYLALGVLLRATGRHAAVWATAAMFAVAHLYDPLGMPYLFAVGLALGYFRVAGGGLALPVLLHFSHNLAVLAAEGAG